jgi:hypothetical protein
MMDVYNTQSIVVSGATTYQPMKRMVMLLQDSIS